MIMMECKLSDVFFEHLYPRDSVMKLMQNDSQFEEECAHIILLCYQNVRDFSLWPRIYYGTSSG